MTQQYKPGDKIFILPTLEIETVFYFDEQHNRIFSVGEHRAPEYRIAWAHIDNVCLVTPEMEKVLERHG